MSTHRAYNRDVEIDTSMVVCHIHENGDGTIFLHFEDSLSEYGVTMDARECAELRATLKAAEDNVPKKHERR